MRADHAAVPGNEESLDEVNNLTRTQAAILSWMPFKYEHGLEANGLCLDVWARATVGMASMFLGPALLTLAKQAAGCGVTDENEACTNLVYGFRPSSLLTNLAAVTGLMSTIGLPVIGSVIDHTCYRRHVGLYTAWGLILVKAIEIGVSSRTWFLVVCLQVLSGMLFQLHITASYSYISELSRDTTEQAHYNAYFFLLMYLSTTVFLILVSGFGWYLETDDVNTARISQIFTSVTGLLCFPIAWTFLFRNRPTLRPVPEHQTLCSAGFYKTLNTMQTIRCKYRELMWLYVSITFGEAASGTLVAVATTYMKEVLDMNGNEIGLVFLLCLIGGLPGSQLGKLLTKRLRNPITCLLWCDALFIASTTAASVFLQSPQQKNWVYLFGLLWGLALGWMSPQHTTCLVPILPTDQAAELMGLYIFCTQILSWLPPLVFTFLNENGVDMSVGLASLNVFFVMAMLCLWIIQGRYERAKQLLENETELDETMELSAAIPTVSDDEPNRQHSRNHATFRYCY